MIELTGIIQRILPAALLTGEKQADVVLGLPEAYSVARAHILETFCA